MIDVYAVEKIYDLYRDGKDLHLKQKDAINLQKYIREYNISSSKQEIFLSILEELKDEGIFLRYSKETVDYISKTSSLLSIVAMDKGKLTKIRSYNGSQGRGAFFLCNFHSEKTPSMSVAYGKNFYYCFGCGSGGTVLTYMMKKYNFEFVDILKLLSASFKIKIPNNDFENDSSSKEIGEYFISDEYDQLRNMIYGKNFETLTFGMTENESKRYVSESLRRQYMQNPEWWDNTLKDNGQDVKTYIYRNPNKQIKKVLNTEYLPF